MLRGLSRRPAGRCSVASAVGPLVDEVNDPGAERLRPGELQPRLAVFAVEQALAAAHDHRELQQVELVQQALTQQPADQRAAAAHVDVPAGPLLELADLLGYIAAD